MNGQNLGRHWSVGPQNALYLPGPWLKSGDNQVNMKLEMPCLASKHVISAPKDTLMDYPLSAIRFIYFAVGIGLSATSESV